MSGRRKNRSELSDDHFNCRAPYLLTVTNKFKCKYQDRSAHEGRSSMDEGPSVGPELKSCA